MSPLLERLREALAPRYEVESEVASGGMGTVFGARDTTLDRRVAIKVLRPEETSSSAAQRLFREARILASLSHPHVVSIFDAGEVDDCFYFVMDYVEGETLEQRLARGPLSAEETTRLADNLLDALAAAHGQGIIHRDVKPSNVFIQEDHFLLGDFGIAKKLETKTGLTEPEHRVGTPGYMAPEQAAGDEVTAATDIYSAGMVLYEAATGKPWSIMHASQMDWSAVPGPLVRPLKRALEWEPEDRWPNAADFREAIVEAERRPRGRTAIISAVAAVALTAVIAGSLLLRPKEPGLDPNKIIVAPFENLTGDESLDPLRTLAMDWVIQGITQTGLVQVVSSTAALHAEQSTIAAAGVAPVVDRTLGMAEATGAAIVITGSYYLEGDSLQFQVQITDASRDELLSAPEPVGTGRDAPRQGVIALRQRVMGALGVSFNPLLGEEPAELKQPPQWDAYEEYAKGLQRAVDLDLRPALAHFYRAAQLDTTFVAAKLWAAFILYQTRQLEQVDSIIQLLEQSRDQLTRADRDFLDFLEAFYVTDDAQDAYDAVLRRVEIAEDPIWLWLLAYTARSVNQVHITVDALERMDPEALAGKAIEPWYWSFKAWDYHFLGEDERALSVAREGRQRRPTSGRILAAEIGVLAARGRLEEMHRTIDEAFSMTFDETRWPPPDVLDFVIDELYYHGYPQAAQEVAQRCLAWYRARTPEQYEELTGRNALIYDWNLALWLYWTGQFGEARSIYERLVQEAPEYIPFVGRLGELAARTGDREEALRIDEQLEQMGNNFWRAGIAAQLGERERALTLVRDVLAAGAWAINIQHSWALEPLWNDPAFQQLIEPKG